MKYKVTLNNRTYEVEVEAGQAMLVDEYEAYALHPPQPLHPSPQLRLPHRSQQPPHLPQVRSSKVPCPATF